VRRGCGKRLTPPKMAQTYVATTDTPPTVAMWDAANFLCLYGNNVVRLNLLAVAALLAAGAVAASPALDRTESSLPSDLASCTES
jgi:hypothetical protein